MYLSKFVPLQLENKAFSHRMHMNKSCLESYFLPIRWRKLKKRIKWTAKIIPSYLLNLTHWPSSLFFFCLAHMYVGANILTLTSLRLDKILKYIIEPLKESIDWRKMYVAQGWSFFFVVYRLILTWEWKRFKP